jgi:hypothetical protein
MDTKDTRTDIKDIRTDIKDTRTDIKDIRTDIKDTRTDTKDTRTDTKDTRTDIYDYSNVCFSFMCIEKKALTIKSQWSLYVPHSGHYMYHQFNIQKFYVLSTLRIFVFCMDLRANSDHFCIEH